MARQLEPADQYVRTNLLVQLGHRLSSAVREGKQLSVIDRMSTTVANSYWLAQTKVRPSTLIPLRPDLVAEIRHQAELLEKQAQADDAGAHTAWADWRGQIRRGLMHDDLSNFLMWPAVAYTMFVRHGPYVRSEMATLRKAEAWKARWKPALREDSLGHPLPCLIYPASSANLIHHTFHVYALEQVFGRPISSFDSVIEFGGGYGGNLRTLRKLGFRGEMQIFDFPELGLLQEFYISALADTDAEGPMAGANDTVSYVSQMTDLNAVSTKTSLFTAMWSISETPPEFREEWVDVMAACSHVFIGLQKQFYDVNNREWFTNMTRRLSNFDWTWQEIGNGRDNYLFGVKR